jgi:hypothetical protein
MSKTEHTWRGNSELNSMADREVYDCAHRESKLDGLFRSFFVGHFAFLYVLERQSVSNNIFYTFFVHNMARSVHILYNSFVLSEP